MLYTGLQSESLKQFDSEFVQWADLSFEKVTSVDAQT